MRSKGTEIEMVRVEELLADPMVWLVMRADGVDRRELAEMLNNLSRKLAARSHDPKPKRGRFAISDDDTPHYRPGVGIMLLNNRNEVFVGRRINATGPAWQMPQGGIEIDEDPGAAAFRELKEEIGTDKARIIAASKTWLRYDFPLSVREAVWGRRWRGQRQIWFVMRFEGDDADINIATAEPEFMDWKWVPMSDLPDIVVPFKRPLYADLVAEFADLGAAVAAGSD